MGTRKEWTVSTTAPQASLLPVPTFLRPHQATMPATVDLYGDVRPCLQALLTRFGVSSAAWCTVETLGAFRLQHVQSQDRLRTQVTLLPLWSPQAPLQLSFGSRRSQYANWVFLPTLWSGLSGLFGSWKKVDCI